MIRLTKSQLRLADSLICSPRGGRAIGKSSLQPARYACGLSIAHRGINNCTDNLRQSAAHEIACQIMLARCGDGGLVRPSPRRSMLTWRSPWALAAIPHGGPTSAVRFLPLSRRSIATAPASPRWRISRIASAAADLRPSSPHSPDAAPLHRRP